MPELPATQVAQLPTPPDTFYVRRGKRLLDIAAGGMILVISTPVQIAVALAVRKWLGSPALFRQERPGLSGLPFTILKFRTMTDDRDASGRLLPDDQRLNGFGRLLRSTSLDELPELVNVVRGDLSLVGPRPLLTQYLERYTPRQAQRHTVRPGVTGLAQVSGRNNLSWDDRFELDLRYVERVSLGLDLRILARTVGKVIARDDVSAAGHVTMPEFEGRLRP